MEQSRITVISTRETPVSSFLDTRCPECNGLNGHHGGCLAVSRPDAKAIAKSARKLVYEFLNLPYHKQYERAKALGLVEPQLKSFGDVSVADELALWALRAKEKGPDVVNALIRGEVA